MAKKTIDHAKLDAAVAAARQNAEQREQGYRAKALKMYPWVCGRCERVFDRAHLHELTVHHRNHDHDDNPEDGSNWELLCLFCHDNEHQRLIEQATAEREATTAPARHAAFASLGELLKKDS